MTANHEHILSTAQVRFAATFPNENFSLKVTDFDRWLAARDARIEFAAEQRGAARALREAADALKTDVEWVFNTNRGIIIKEDEADPGISPWAWLRDRADQMEGDDV